MNRSIPSGIQINSKNPRSFDFCQVTHLSIKNKSNGTIFYSFKGVKFELDIGENDIFPSPHNTMDGKIEFSIPSSTTIVNIKIKIVQILIV